MANVQRVAVIVFGLGLFGVWGCTGKSRSIEEVDEREGSAAKQDATARADEDRGPVATKDKDEKDKKDSGEKSRKTEDEDSPGGGSQSGKAEKSGASDDGAAEDKVIDSDPTPAAEDGEFAGQPARDAAPPSGEQDADAMSAAAVEEGSETDSSPAGGAEHLGADGDAGVLAGQPTAGTPAPSADPSPKNQEPATSPWGFDNDPAHPIFDQNQLRRYTLEVDPDEWAHINETAYLEEYIQGQLRVDGEVYGPVGVRFKGFRGSLYNCFRFDDEGRATARTCDKLSIKVSFNEYDSEGRFFGLKKLNFHAMNNDPHKLRERVAYFLFRRFGVPAPRAVHATLTVNGQDLGLYSLVEQIDGRFTRMRFADGGKGNVYKERWPTSSSDSDYFLSGLKTNENDPDVDVGGMVAFAQGLAAAQGDAIEDVLRSHTNFDALMRYVVVDRALDNWDGITAFRCRPEEEVPPLPPVVREAQTPPLGWEVCQNKNFYWYEEVDSARMWLVAWDVEMSASTFPSPFPRWDEPPAECPILQSGRPPMCDPLIAAFSTNLRPHYLRAGRTFLDEVFTDELLSPLVRAWGEQIAPYLQGGLFARDADSLLDRLAERRAAFEAELQRE